MLLYVIYNWLSTSSGSASADTTSHGSNILKKIPESSKKQTLILLLDGSYFHSIYIVLSIMSKDLKYIGRCVWIVCKYCVILCKEFEHPRSLVSGMEF